MKGRIIHKFGGSCLREPDDIEKIAEVIRSDEQAILVVSALWGTTEIGCIELRETLDMRVGWYKICPNNISVSHPASIHRKMRICFRWFSTISKTL